MDHTELERLKEEFLKTNKIKYIGKKVKKRPVTEGLIVIHSYDTTEVIL